MRYLYIVAGVILIILGISGMTFLRSRPPESREMIRINDRIITTEEFEREYSEATSLYNQKKDRKEFIEDLITKELLLQEAKRRGLDLKPDFRRAIQNYYEQTLLKNLTQERMAEIDITVTEEEIASYYENMGKVFIIRTILFPDEEGAKKALKGFPSDKGELKTLYLDELPDDLLNDILNLREGETLNRPIKTDQGFLVLKVEAIRKAGVPPIERVRDEIKRILVEKKRRSEMERWLADLRKKAIIKVKKESNG
jgi:parvulin-like peptidyl-prolyl isomerase